MNFGEPRKRKTVYIAKLTMSQYPTSSEKTPIHKVNGLSSGSLFGSWGSLILFIIHLLLIKVDFYYQAQVVLFRY
jgi:hypothetical protein